MATVTIYGDASDAWFSSGGSVYADEREGVPPYSGGPAATDGHIGQVFTTIYAVYQYLAAFDTSDVNGTPSAASLALFAGTDSSATDFTVEVRLFDWSTYVAGSALGSLPLLATYDTSSGWSSGYREFTNNGTELSDNLNLAGLTKMVVASDRQRIGTAPTGEERVQHYHANQAGTTQDPKLVVTLTPSASSDEILNPVGDTTSNSWTTDTGGTVGLYAAIDELTASDTDYIQSPAGPDTADYYETALETHADPVSSSGHVVHYRYQKNVAGGNVGLVATLLQGTGVERLTANQGGLETDTTGWVAGTNTTIARSTAQFRSGAASLALTAVAASNVTAQGEYPTHLIPVVPGSAYTLTGYSRAETTGRSMTLEVLFFDKSMANTSFNGNLQTDTTSGWTLHTATGTVDSLDFYALVRFRAIVSLAAGEVHYLDDVSLVMSPAVHWIHTNIANSWVTQDQTLTAPQADSITDYSDLRLRFTPNMVTTDQTVPVPTKVADRASANSNSAVTTVDLALTGLTVGNYLIIRSAADNSGGGGAARTMTVSNQSGSAMGTHTEYQQNNDPGAASAGTTCNVSVIKIAATSGTIRLTYAGSVVQACVAEEWSGIHATTPVAAGSATANGTASTQLAPMNSAPVSLVAGNVVYGVEAVEGPTSDTYTQDSDTTRGTWVSLTKLGTSNGTAETNQTTYGAYKLVTANGAQAYGPTISPARDSAGIQLELAAAPAPAPTIKAQVSWANLELPAGAATFPHYAGINLGVNWLPTVGPISAGATDS